MIFFLALFFTERFFSFQFVFGSIGCVTIDLRCLMSIHSLKTTFDVPWPDLISFQKNISSLRCPACSLMDGLGSAFFKQHFLHDTTLPSFFAYDPFPSPLTDEGFEARRRPFVLFLHFFLFETI